MCGTETSLMWTRPVKPLNPESYVAVTETNCKSYLQQGGPKCLETFEDLLCFLLHIFCLTVIHVSVKGTFIKSFKYLTVLKRNLLSKVKIGI